MQKTTKVKTGSSPKPQTSRLALTMTISVAILIANTPSFSQTIQTKPQAAASTPPASKSPSKAATTPTATKTATQKAPQTAPPAPQSANSTSQASSSQAAKTPATQQNKPTQPPTQVSAQSSTSADASQAKSFKERESTGLSLEKCLVSSAPDFVLGVGLIAALSNPLIPVVSILFASSSYGICYYERQTDRPDDVDLTVVVDEAARRLEDTTKNMFIDAASAIDERAEAVNETAKGLDQRLRNAGQRERDAINGTGAAVIRQIYEEIEVIKKGEFEIREKTSEEYSPSKIRPRLKIDQ